MACFNNLQLKGKGLVRLIVLFTQVRLVTRNTALQSQKWQVFGVVLSLKVLEFYFDKRARTMLADC